MHVHVACACCMCMSGWRDGACVGTCAYIIFESTLKVLYAVDYYTFYKRRRDNSNTAMRARMAQCALPYSSHTPECVCVCVGGGGGGGGSWCGGGCGWI